MYFKTYCIDNIMTNAKRVLIGSPVCQKPKILSEFLISLGSLDTQNVVIDYFFIDDNNDLQSSHLLDMFSKCYENTIILKNKFGKNQDVYLTDNSTHHWNENLVWKVAEFKNQIIEHAIKQDYDYLFLIDSDILINPNLINHLITTNKDIVSEVFWTRWNPLNDPLPQVWLSDFYTLYQIEIGERIDEMEKTKRQSNFLNKLKVPGTYEVGGLGACTLLSVSALKKGLNFNRIKNLTFWGEDRHFCIRAAALGFELWADTHYPPYHIYREQELEGTENFKTLNGIGIGTKTKISKILSPSLSVNTLTLNQKVEKNETQKLVVGMCIHNEADNFLTDVLLDIKQYANHVVIVDDASTDNSAEICKNILNGISFEIIKNDVSKFSNEVELRKQLWDEIVKNNPDWIMILDADEIFENRFKSVVRDLINQKNEIHLYRFRLHDFWNETQYRDDSHWCAHNYYKPFLLRYKKGFDYTWKNTKQHCGRFPNNIYQDNNASSDLRLKHFGWSTSTLRENKYKRYMELDPYGLYGNMDQYLSILDENVNLIDFME
jgi:GT2 family glycosyltransferase